MAKFVRRVVPVKELIDILTCYLFTRKEMILVIHSVVILPGKEELTKFPLLLTCSLVAQLVVTPNKCLEGMGTNPLNIIWLLFFNFYDCISAAKIISLLLVDGEIQG